MSNSVGQINLDLILNNKDFQKQLSNTKSQADSVSSGIAGSLKKIGVAVAAAFSVKAIASFSKSCIDLGSDLAEVQNVVDVTFPAMTAKADAWAKSASAQFGLSETMAKRYAGTLGSMAEAFGFSEKEAYNMSTTLAGLAGDVASFYNIDQDAAYTKLKAVFSGETEGLKDLGVVMTQSALDSYALANGFGKVTSKMTESEKVALRYSFVQDKLKNATGDFARTSDSWANQTRLLQLRFDSLKASLGQAFIKVLTPVIKILNTIIEKITAAADTFSNFISKVFGSEQESGVGQAATAVAEASSGMEDSSDTVSDNLGKASKKAKEIKNSLAGFDKLNVITKDTSNSDSSNNSGGNTANASTNVKMPSGETQGKKYASGLKKAFKNLYKESGLKNFVDNIQKGIDRVNWKQIGKNCKSIFNSLKPIAASAFEGVKKIGKSAFGALGAAVGGFVTIGGKNFQTLSGGIAKWLSKDKKRISKFIDDFSTNFANGFDNLKDFYDTFYGAIGASIDEMRPKTEKALSKLLSGFTTFGISVGTVISSAFEIATGSLSKWATENEETIKTSFNNLQEMFNDVAEFFGGVFDDIGTIISDWWNGEDGGAKIFQNVCDMFTSIGTTLMNVWNNWIKPVWDFIVSVIQSAWDSCLKPIFSKIISVFGKLADCISTLWNNWLSPIVNFLIKTLKPVFVAIFNAIKRVFQTVFDILGGVIGGLIDALGGLIDFITGVFSGNWKKAWKGIKNFFKGIWDGIWSIVKGVVNLIIDGINLLWTGIYTVVSSIVNAIGGIAGAIGDLFGCDWSFSMPEEPPLIPRLAKGGIVSAPTLALVGDNAGASTGNPEVVSPLNKLQNMIDTSGGQDTEVLMQILSYLKKIYELFVLFRKQGGSSYEYVAKMNGSELFREIVKQDRIYRKRHNGKSAFA